MNYHDTLQPLNTELGDWKKVCLRIQALNPQTLPNRHNYCTMTPHTPHTHVHVCTITLHIMHMWKFSRRTILWVQIFFSGEWRKFLWFKAPKKFLMLLMHNGCGRDNVHGVWETALLCVDTTSTRTSKKLHVVKSTSMNTHNQYTVAVEKNRTIKDHLQRKVSRFCTLFLKKGGHIHCRVTGLQRYTTWLVYINEALE